MTDIKTLTFAERREIAEQARANWKDNIDGEWQDTARYRMEIETLKRRLATEKARADREDEARLTAYKREYAIVREEADGLAAQCEREAESAQHWQDRAQYWQMVADGINHDPRCATHFACQQPELAQKCIRCQAEDARAERDALRAELAADDARLRAAEARVWPDTTWGCDAPEHLAEAILALRAELAALKGEAPPLPLSHCQSCGEFKGYEHVCAVQAGAPTKWARCGACGWVGENSELPPDPAGHPCGADKCPHCGVEGCITCCYDTEEEAETGEHKTAAPHSAPTAMPPETVSRERAIRAETWEAAAKDFLTLKGVQSNPTVSHTLDIVVRHCRAQAAVLTPGAR